MIGIDLTRISRFESMSEHRLQHLASKFNTEWPTAKHAAKWWACHEAVIKCIGKPPNWQISMIHFPKGSAPVYTGAESIKLSLSHEGDYVTAIAILEQS